MQALGLHIMRFRRRKISDRTLASQRLALGALSAFVEKEQEARMNTEEVPEMKFLQVGKLPLMLFLWWFCFRRSISELVKQLLRNPWAFGSKDRPPAPSSSWIQVDFDSYLRIPFSPSALAKNLDSILPATMILAVDRASDEFPLVLQTMKWIPLPDRSSPRPPVSPSSSDLDHSAYRFCSH